MKGQGERAAAAGAGPGLAERLGEARVELRRDLDVSRHVFRGEVSYVILDPLTFQSHRLSTADYYVLTRISVDRTLGECFQALVESGHLTAADEERFFGFVLAQHRHGLLKLPISDQDTLYQRHLAKRDQRRKSRLMGVLFWQVPLWNPDRFLTRTLRWVGPLFTRWAFVAWWALIGTALYTLVENWAEFRRPVADIFSGSNLPILWATLVVLKVAHEFGHAYSCRQFGGHVPEMGAFLILFTPCAFVDTTAAWSFARKRDRLAVNLAGMYVEIAIAAVALMLWSVTSPGLLKQCLHNVVLLASVVTVGFNVNPLMKFDGYYALADLIEVPNLRARSQAYATDVLKNLVFGVPIARRPKERALRVWLFAFGVASALYKVALVLGISMTIALKFPVVGLLLGATYALREVARLARKALPYLWFSDEVAGVRLRAILCSLLIGALPIGIVGTPIATSVKPQGVVVGGVESVRRAETSGFLTAIHVAPGDVVAAGDTIATLTEADKQANLEMARARLDGARLRQRVWAVTDPAAAAEELERIAALESEVAHLERDLARLSIDSAAGGRVVACIDPDERGRFVRRGEPMATIVQGAPSVRTLLDQDAFAAVRPEVGQRVQFRPQHMPERVLEGIIDAVRPVGSRELPQRFLDHLDLTEYSLHPLTQEASRSQFEVSIAFDASQRDAFRHGMTGRLRFQAESEPLGRMLYRKALVFLGQLGS